MFKVSPLPQGGHRKVVTQNVQNFCSTEKKIVCSGENAVQILNWACADSVKGHNLGIFLKTFTRFQAIVR